MLSKLQAMKKEAAELMGSGKQEEEVLLSEE
jgi:calmodulin